MNGTIRKRGKNSWQLIFDLPRDADGKRKQARRTVHGTKRGAETKLRELLAEFRRRERRFGALGDQAPSVLRLV